MNQIFLTMKFYYCKILFIMALFFMSCGSDKSYDQQIKEYNYYTKMADSLNKVKKFKESFKYSNAAIAITDTLSKAFYTKGISFFELNYLDDAEENFNEVIEIEGDGSVAFKNRALVHLKNNDSDFLDDMNNYLKFFPEDEEAHQYRREYFENEEDYDNAIEEYDLAIEKHKDSLDLYIKRSNLLYLNGDLDEAIKGYERVLVLNPNNQVALVKKRNLLKEINKKDNLLIFVGLLFLFYIVYVTISFFILKPLVSKKATNQIGGNFILERDPLIWVLPIILTITFFTSLFTNTIPNF